MAITDVPHATDNAEVPLYQQKELAKSKISSKGQITLPIEIRKRLGVKEGESVKFVVNNDGRTVILPMREEKENPFLKWIGTAPPLTEFGYEDSVAWVRDMRDDEYEAEQTRIRREAEKLAKSQAA
jgi:AbrB family looped-hinge helix DNA binding protein